MEAAGLREAGWGRSYAKLLNSGQYRSLQSLIAVYSGILAEILAFVLHSSILTHTLQESLIAVYPLVFSPWYYTQVYHSSAGDRVH